MYNDITKPAPPLPHPALTTLLPGISLLPPLSRRGVGPGIIVLTSACQDPLAIENGVPWPLLKWAEEGYAVVEIQAHTLSGDDGPSQALELAVKALASCEKCEPKDKIGLVGVYLLLPENARPRCVGLEDSGLSTPHSI